MSRPKRLARPQAPDAAGDLPAVRQDPAVAVDPSAGSDPARPDAGLPDPVAPGHMTAAFPSGEPCGTGERPARPADPHDVAQDSAGPPEDLPRAAVELALRPGRSASLLRIASGPGQPARRSSSRAVPCRIVWHDTADAALARRGVSLCAWEGEPFAPGIAAGAATTAADASGKGGAQPGMAGPGLVQAGMVQGWQLRRLRQAPALVLPSAQPSPVLAEAPTRDGLDAALPDGLVARAAFHGRCRSVLLPGGLHARLLEGTLRSVEHDRPVSHLLLEGPAPAVGGQLLSRPLPVLVSHPLAELACAPPLAAGAPPPAPVVGEEHSVEEALGRVAGELAGALQFWCARLPDPREQGFSPEPVHQARVACRRLRSALATWRLATGHGLADSLDGELRALAAALGQARDCDVFLAGTGEALRHALPGDRRIDALLSQAARRRLGCYGRLHALLAEAPVEQLLLRVSLLAPLRPWREDASAERAALLASPVKSFAAEALDRALRRMRRRGRGFRHLSADERHEVRKAAKRLRYAAEFFAPLFGTQSARRFLRRIEVLQEALGLLNDAAQSGPILADLGVGGFAAGAVSGFNAARAGSAEQDARRAWRRLRRHEPFWR